MANQTRENENTSVAIVGDGVSALITLAVLAQSGLPTHALTIYGDSPHPMANLCRHAIALGQERMRSESNGHLAPVDFPGMAWTDAREHRSPWPLLASLCDRYNPSLNLVLAQVDALTTRLGFYERKLPVRIANIVRAESAEPAFDLHDCAGQMVGTARHVILALGHAGLAWPNAVCSWKSHPHVMHAYESPIFQAGDRVAVIGSGMAAAHLWSLGLRKGAQVTALHRRPLRYLRLNAPRSAFSAVGIDAYHRLSSADRLQTLREVSHGTFPWRLAWHNEWRRARQRGQFHSIQGELSAMEPVEQDNKNALALHLPTGETIEVDKLVCATGFLTAAQAYPLIAQMTTLYDLPVLDGYLAVADDFTLAPLSQANSVCGVVGSLARWALPVADTFAGMKYAARRLAPWLLN